MAYDLPMMKHQRSCGVLLHPISFYGPHGIGCLGAEAREILNRFRQAGVTLWQILPLGPTGYGDSPYSALSAFAGNELLIDVRTLPGADLSALDNRDTQRVDYGVVRQQKMSALMLCADTFIARAGTAERREFEAFCRRNAFWLDDYALYRVLCEVHNDTRPFMWPRPEARRQPQTIEKLTARHAAQIQRWKVLQFFFRRQWDALHAYANSLGMKIIGDIPIFCAQDSVDVWCNPALFNLDKNGMADKIAGVPPDAFSATGQLWGNPTYNWPEHEKDGFAWWKSRMTQTLSLVDIVRIDHFRGFEACWEVPQGAETAAAGHWVKGPGMKLFKALGRNLPVIAEDLGIITDEVRELLRQTGYPGMAVLQFAFWLRDGKLEQKNAYLPHMLDSNIVAYTGTHDNDTTRSWYDWQDEATKDMLRRYFQCPDSDIVWQMIRTLLMSRADYVIIPAQDIAGLGQEGRMNQPSTVGTSNWSWRLRRDDIRDWMFERLREMNSLYGRDGE